MSHQKHVFISHSHKDSAVATSVVTALEQRGVPCWIAPRDVAPGGSYAESILTAIETASCFVLIYSEHSNMSSHVLREVERALRFGVNIVPVRFDDSTPSKSLDYLLATVHWLAVPGESRDRSIAKAAEQIAEWLTNFMKNPATPLPLPASRFHPALVTSLEPPRKRSGMLVGAVILLALMAGGFATGLLPLPNKSGQNEAVTSTSPALPAFAKSIPAIVPAAVTTAHGSTPNLNRPIGYAGVDQPRAVRSTTPLYNSTVGNQFPPPPPGPPISQYGNGPGPGAPPDGRYPPPPPPPPGSGRPMFGPGNGAGPGMPLNPGGPRP